MTDKRVIRLCCDTNTCITTEEYEKMIHELEVKQLAGTLTSGDRILASVLHYMHTRYCQIVYTRESGYGTNS